jgi:hypothetical protein
MENDKVQSETVSLSGHSSKADGRDNEVRFSPRLKIPRLPTRAEFEYNYNIRDKDYAEDAWLTFDRARQSFYFAEHSAIHSEIALARQRSTIKDLEENIADSLDLKGDFACIIDWMLGGDMLLNSPNAQELFAELRLKMPRLAEITAITRLAASRHLEALRDGRVDLKDADENHLHEVASAFGLPDSDLTLIATGKKLSHVQRHLPAVAPKKWKEMRHAFSDPELFVEQIYKEWLGRGLTMSHVRKLDEPLAQALYYHVRKHGPLRIDLPTKVETNSRALREIAERGSAIVAGEVLGEHTLREARRLDSARQRRRVKGED